MERTRRATIAKMLQISNGIIVVLVLRGNNESAYMLLYILSSRCLTQVDLNLAKKYEMKIFYTQNFDEEKKTFKIISTNTEVKAIFCL
jgi:hypothetical protein